MSDLWPWLVVFGLGLFHGVNPAMGWLFAVALGLQEQKRAAVLRALAPIALGHALSIGIILAAVILARISVPHRTLKIAAAAILFAFGLYRLFRSRHPKWIGMRVGFGDLTLWSFIMASAHGAGLMLVPLFLASSPMPDAHHVGSHDGIHHTFAWGFANFSRTLSADGFRCGSHAGISFNDGTRCDAGLRKVRCWHATARLVQRRFDLDGCIDDNRGTHPAPLTPHSSGQNRFMNSRLADN